MGIILKNLETNSIEFYLKGADAVMKTIIPEVKRGFLMNECKRRVNYHRNNMINGKLNMMRLKQI